MVLFNWYHASIKQKIGGLFVLLLSFLLCAIVYSGYKIRQIDQELREVAYLDIPLSQIMRQVEFIELEQHQQFERSLLAGKSYDELKRHQQLAFQKHKMKSLLDKAVQLIEQNIAQQKLVLNPAKHEQVLQEIQHYAIHSQEFEQHLAQVIGQDSVTDAEHVMIESMADELEASGKVIITHLENITSQDAYYTEQHEKDFLFVSALLGAGAIGLGLFLTVYIVRIILRRIRNIQGEIHTMTSALQQSEFSSALKVAPLQSRDELAELEYDINLMMSRLSEEIISREAMEKQLLVLATQDKLTGAFNRHKWEEQVQLQIALAARGDYYFGLVLLDVDYFKRVNDRHGHQTGDQLLQLLVAQIKQRIRSSDMLFRLGGEEFAILLPMQDSNSSYQLADNIRQRIEDLQCDDLPSFTISAGVTSYLPEDDEVSLFKRADMGLYDAKGQGRNQVVVQQDNK